MNRTTTPRWRAALAAAALTASLVACAGGSDDASDTTVVSTTRASTTTSSTTTTIAASSPPAPTTTTTAAPTTTTTTLPPVPRQPLTGAVRGKGEPVIDRPALVVKIDNAPAARRNHSGLAAADIVFEEIVEGRITRFAAVFHSQGSPVVGPIRSGRSQDVDLLTSLRRPLFAWSGGNPGVTELIANSSLTDLNWQRGGRGYYRGSGRAPHNLYNDTDTLWAQTPPDHPGPPALQYRYVRPGRAAGGRPVDGFSVRLHGIDVDWTWDAERGQFMRSQEGATHVDQVFGPIGTTNVVVMVVQYLPSRIDARSPEAQTIGGGPAFVFRNGRLATGRWQRATADEPIRFVDADGRRIPFHPGNTWIELAEAIATDEPARPDVDLEIRFADDG